jgi:hypothetical protein
LAEEFDSWQAYRYTVCGADPTPYFKREALSCSSAIQPEIVFFDEQLLPPRSLMFTLQRRQSIFQIVANPLKFPDPVQVDANAIVAALILWLRLLQLRAQ